MLASLDNLLTWNELWPSPLRKWSTKSWLRGYLSIAQLLMISWSSLYLWCMLNHFVYTNHYKVNIHTYAQHHHKRSNSPSLPFGEESEALVVRTYHTTVVCQCKGRVSLISHFHDFAIFWYCMRPIMVKFM